MTQDKTLESNMPRADSLRIRFGQRVREIRRRQGLSLERLAERAKLNDKFIQAIETGRQSPSIDTIEKLAIGLDVDVRELLVIERDVGDGAAPRQKDPERPPQLARGTMRPETFSELQRIQILREADRAPIGEVARKHGITEQTIYAWRGRLGTIRPDEMERLALLEAENARLKKLLAERPIEREAPRARAEPGDEDGQA
jgi:putative transposase